MAERLDRRHLRRVLAVLTEGHRAPVSRAMRRAASEAYHDARGWLCEGTVQGVGIGWRNSARRSGGLCIKLYVSRKEAASTLACPAPAEILVPGFEQPVPIDVHAIGEVSIQTKERKPRGPGSSIGLEDPREGFGTFGCIVRKRGSSEELYLLSNCHVIARDGLAPSGSTNVLSPSGRHGGVREQHLIGILAESSKPVFSERRHFNYVDAAIARIIDPDGVTALVEEIGAIRGVARSIRPLQSVRMFGAGSGLSKGVVMDPDFRLGLRYRDASGGMRRAGFAEQVLCSDFTTEGDSGAIVLNNRSEVVGLHFAGAKVDGVEHSVFNRIDNVLNELDLELVTDLPGSSKVGRILTREEARDVAGEGDVRPSPPISGLAGLVWPHRFRGGVEWRLTAKGLEVEGRIEGDARTSGHGATGLESIPERDTAQFR